MGTKFLQKSLVAVVFSLLLILLYIGFRFKKIGGLTGGLMAVLALLNDLMVVFGTFVLLRTRWTATYCRHADHSGLLDQRYGCGL